MPGLLSTEFDILAANKNGAPKGPAGQILCGKRALQPRLAMNLVSAG